MRSFWRSFAVSCSPLRYLLLLPQPPQQQCCMLCMCCLHYMCFCSGWLNAKHNLPLWRVIICQVVCIIADKHCEMRYREFRCQKSIWRYYNSALRMLSWCLVLLRSSPPTSPPRWIASTASPPPPRWQLMFSTVGVQLDTCLLYTSDAADE